MNPTDTHTIILVTAPNQTVARKLASVLLNEKVVACVNLIPKIESLYWWDGNIEASSEVLMLLKTRISHVDRVEQIVVASHPYDTPEIVSLKLDSGNAKYLDWLTASVPDRK